MEIISPNVILHVKWSTSDLENADVRGSDFSKVEVSSYDANDYEYRFIDATNGDGSTREHTESSPSTVPHSSVTEIMFGKNDMPSIDGKHGVINSIDRVFGVSELECLIGDFLGKPKKTLKSIDHSSKISRLEDLIS